MARRFPVRRLTAAGLAVGLVATVVSAQPTTLPVAPPQEPAPLEAPPEEAPPAVVAAPAPLIAPPVKDEEVAPAPPPKEKVAEKPVEAPIRRERYAVAVLQALDKVTAETLRFEAEVGRPVRWKGLVFTVRACERSAPDEPIQDAIAYLTVESQPRPQPGRPTPAPREAFKGWMFASSPSLHPMEHATYDAWVINCRTVRPLTPAATEPRPVSAAPPAKKTEPAAGPAPKAATPSPKAASPAPKGASPAPKAEPAPTPPAKAAPTPAPTAPAPPQADDPIL